MINKEKILEQFEKQIFVYGKLCSKPIKSHRDYIVCGFFEPDRLFVKWQYEKEENYCYFYGELLHENKRCQQCLENYKEV